MLKMKISRMFFCTGFTFLLLGAITVNVIASGVGNYISLETAKQTAIVKVPGSTVSGVELDTGKKGAKYEVKLYDDIYRYEVDIDAVTGEVTGFEQKNNKKKNVATIDTSALIGIETAKKTALDSVGVSEEVAIFTEVETEREKGIIIYEIKFISNEVKYEIEVNASTGGIVKQKQKNVKGIDATALDGGIYIGIESAKAAAVNHCGFSINDVSFTKLKTDKDDGMYIYEIDFIGNNAKYEYEIDAVTGEFIEFEID